MIMEETHVVVLIGFFTCLCVGLFSAVIASNPPHFFTAKALTRFRECQE